MASRSRSTFFTAFVFTNDRSNPYIKGTCFVPQPKETTDHQDEEGIAALVGALPSMVALIGATRTPQIPLRVLLHRFINYLAMMAPALSTLY